MDKAALQALQASLRLKLIVAFGRASDSKYNALVAQYDETVSQLQEILGADAHCCEVDCEAWDIYSDVYKSDVGVRPRGHVTLTEVTEYLNKRRETA